MSQAANSYDPRRFETTVPYYSRYRLGYPDLLIRRVIAHVGLRPGDAVMDLGCGPGLLAIPFAKAGMTVTGIDPEPAMLEAAAAAARDAGVALDLKQGSSFDMPAGIGPFKLVTMGRSFHWMDREATLEILDRMVMPDGSVALLHDHHTKTAENSWRRALHDIADAYGRGDAFHVQARERDDFHSHESVLMRSAFSHLERVSVFVKAPRTVDDIVGLAFSLSTTAPQKLGDRKDRFERELRAKLAELSPDGRFEEIAEMTALIATRK
jgi:ubiquinone/menaquinone biosynthesis C-methylase UbiE